MEITSILCEVHPQLRVANLYVKFSKTAKLNAATVVDNSVILESTESKKNHVMLKFPVSIKLLDNYKIQFTLVDEEYVHLRMPIGVPSGMMSGSENIEVLDLLTLTSHGYASQGEIFNPSVDKEYRIQCAECQSVLVDSVRFKRVLPLPRVSWSEAASDWYCHLHAGEENHQKLLPRSTDCLYGSCYHALTTSLLVDGSLDSGGAGGKESLCFKCQSSIGLVDGNEFWNAWCHSIQWLFQENNKWKKAADVTTPLQAFYLTLYDALDEEKSFFGRKLAFRDGLRCGQTLILWFVGDNGYILESKEKNGKAEIELCRSRLHKVLFKTGMSAKEKIPTDVSEYQVSGQMIHSALSVLRNSCELLPPSRRTAAGFSIGYLSLAS